MLTLKRMFLVITVVSAIAVAMTHTVTLFSGQHSWYDLSGSGSNVPCLKCHEDIWREQVSGGVHASIDCECCHRASKMVGYGAVDGGQVEPGQEAHSASTEECMLCHNGRRIPETNFTHYYLNESSCLQCHDPVPAILAAAAGGFGGFTPDLDDTGANATHRSFVLEAIDDPLMEGENEACIGCHTDTSVNISHVIPQGYKLDLDRACDWDVKITSYNFTTVKGSE